MRTWSMHGLENEGKQPSNLTLNDGEEGCDRGDGARGGCPLAKAFSDRGQYFLHTADVRLRCDG